MTFGEHITILRKRKNLSQAELGKAVGTSGDIIGKYERDEVKPSVEVAAKIADALDVSLDYLVGKTDLQLDKQAIKRLEDISKLPSKDKEHIFYALDGLIKSAKLQTL